jgi:hypothetical protein
VVTTDRPAGKIDSLGVIAMDRQTVKVYVRAGSNKGERLLSFQPPKEVQQTEWISRGLALDGNSVTTSVTALTGVAELPEKIPGFERLPPHLRVEGVRYIRRLMTYPEGSPGSNRTLSQALHEVEAWLVEWLAELGYNVEFA